jgi:hypothetical protein
VSKAQPSNPAPLHMLRGTVRHAGLEAAFRAAQLATRHVVRATMYDEFAGAALAAMSAGADSLEDADLDRACEDVLDVLKAIPVPNPASVVAVECPFRLEVDGVQVEGKIDLVLRTGSESIHLRDWKSSGPPKTVDGDRQLAVYHTAARTLWPWAREITVGLYGIRTRRECTGVVEDDYAAAVLADMADDAHWRGSHFDPSPGEHCLSCRFRSYCPVYTGPAPLMPGFPAEDVASTGDYLESLLFRNAPSG